MGIKIELTDDDLQENEQTIVFDFGEGENAMDNPPADCRGIEDKILLMIRSREDGCIEIHPGSCGHVLLHSEKEAEQFCESVIRQIRSGKQVAEIPKKDKLTNEDARNLSFLPVVAKEDDGCVIIIPMGEGVVRIEDKEAAKRLSDSIIELFDVS